MTTEEYLRDELQVAALSLSDAASQFQHYHDLHMQKNPPDTVKANTNKLLAECYLKAAWRAITACEEEIG